MNAIVRIEELKVESGETCVFWMMVSYIYGVCISERIMNAILENLLNLKRDQPESELKIDYQTSSTLLLWIQNPCIVSV